MAHLVIQLAHGSCDEPAPQRGRLLTSVGRSQLHHVDGCLRPSEGASSTTWTVAYVRRKEPAPPRGRLLTSVGRSQLHHVDGCLRPSEGASSTTWTVAYVRRKNWYTYTLLKLLTPSTRATCSKSGWPSSTNLTFCGASTRQNADG